MWLNKNIINFLKKSEDGLGGVREMYMGVDKKCKKKRLNGNNNLIN